MHQAGKAGFSQETLKELARAQGLEFTEERLQRIAPRVERLMADLGELAQVDLSGVEPAVNFQAKQG